MIGVEVKLDTRDFERALRRLSEKEIPRALSKALNRTSFEALEELKRESLSAFEKATPRAKQLLAGRGSFVFQQATPDRLVATITPGPNPPKRGQLLAEHQRGGTIFETPARLGLANADLLAVPIGEAQAKRARTGRLPATLQPARLLDRGTKGRGFLVMRGGRGVLLVRRGRKKASRAVPLFAIVPKAELPKRFHWRETIERAAAKWLPIKAREEIAKLKRTVR